MTGSSNFLLDTNIISALFKGEKTIADRIDNADEVYIPVIVLGELYYGARYSTNVQKNIDNINRLVQTYEVLNSNQETASIYGEIKASLRKKGKPIPENDIWIATIAKQYQLTLVTRDRHFNEIDALLTAKW
ncbi:tRNA(fMet)-specific endonuclease VapC [Pedobacter cryoconitis]|uniref:Ribonuclease VapC n=2 Tax=Pedobacter cryoconitis TaxID=188932 RepID=A0A327SQY0_9SPHI|nr:tRNA(fMet)-specific endonuclease VapC [Pedobacter cryoconitis]